MRLGIDIRGVQSEDSSPARQWAWRVMRRLAQFWPAEAGEIVWLIAPGQNPPHDGAPCPATRTEVAPGLLCDFPAGRPATTAVNGAYNAWLARLNLDALHVWDALNPTVVLPAHIIACPCLITLLDEFPFARLADLDAPDSRRVYLEWYVERAGLLMRADHVIVLSEPARRDAQAVLGLGESQVSVASSQIENAAVDLVTRYRLLARPDRPKPLRVAMWTPLRPTRSGIADYVEELLPFLAHSTAPAQTAGPSDAPALQWQIDLYTQDEPTTHAVRDQCIVLPPSAFEAIHQHHPYDACVYHIGSTPEHHGYICQQSLEYPGLLVMHDPNIHSYALQQSQGGAQMDIYLEWVRRELGERMVPFARQAWREGTFREKLIYEYYMDRWLLSRARGAIYHSHFAAQDARSRLPGVPAFYVPLYAPLPERPNRAQRERILARHGWPPDTVLIGVYGIVAPSKRIDVVLRAYRMVQDSHPNARLLIVGSADHYDLAGEIERAGADASRICVTGEVSMPDFIAYMQASDIGVSLRYPSLGESSAIISRLIGMGKPIITSDIPQFRELPETFCWRAPVGGEEVEIVSRYLIDLIEHPERRQAMGRAARQYGQAGMSPHIASQGYRQVILHLFKDGPAPRLEVLIPDSARERAESAVRERQKRQHPLPTVIP